MSPAKSILDPTFRYTSSANTDLRRTFSRVRYEIELERKAREQREASERDPAANDDGEAA